MVRSPNSRLRAFRNTLIEYRTNRNEKTKMMYSAIRMPVCDIFPSSETATSG
ncbi:hypothetical protein D3C73_1486860 [compost metagenome]